jgi:hypothetical protein
MSDAYTCQSCAGRFWGKVGDFQCNYPHCKGKVGVARCEGCDHQFKQRDKEIICEPCEEAILPEIVSQHYDKTPERNVVSQLLPPVLVSIVLTYVKPSERDSGIDLVKLKTIAPELFFTESGPRVKTTVVEGRRRHWITFNDRRYELVLEPLNNMSLKELMTNSAFAHVIKDIDKIAWVCNGDSVELSQRKATFRLIC